MNDKSVYKSIVYNNNIYTITDFLLTAEAEYFVSKKLIDTTLKSDKIFYLYKTENFGVPYPFSDTVTISLFNQYFPDTFKINQ